MLTYGQIYDVVSTTRDLFIYYHENGKLQAGGFFNPINVKGSNPNYTYTFANGITKNIEDVRMCELNEDPSLKEESATAGGSAASSAGGPSGGPSSGPTNVPAAFPVLPSAGGRRKTKKSKQRKQKRRSTRK